MYLLLIDNGGFFNPTFLLEKKGAVDGTKENFAGDRSPCAPRPLLRGSADPLGAPPNPRGRGFLPKG